jgi:hypothetical protein
MYINAGKAHITATTTATALKLPLSPAAPPLNVLGTVEFATVETLAWLLWAGETRKPDVWVGVAIEGLEYGVAEWLIEVVRDDDGASVVSPERVTSEVMADFVMVLIMVLLFSTNWRYACVSQLGLLVWDGGGDFLHVLWLFHRGQW